MQLNTVATLEREFSGARKEASDTLVVLCEQLEKSQTPEDANAQLKQQLSTLTLENVSLLKRTHELTDKRGILRFLAASHCHVLVLQRMVAQHVTRLPFHPGAEYARKIFCSTSRAARPRLTPSSYKKTSVCCCILCIQTKTKP